MINLKSERVFFKYLAKWLFIAGLIGIFSGTASAFFLTLLEKATEIRQGNRNLIYFLPLGGFAVAILYHYWGKSVEAGNNLILDQIHTPKKILQLRMAPMFGPGGFWRTETRDAVIPSEPGRTLGQRRRWAS